MSARKYTWSGPNGPGEGSLADWFRQLPTESLLIRRKDVVRAAKDAVREMKDAQGNLLALDAEIELRLDGVTASVPTAARQDDTDQGARP